MYLLLFWPIFGLLFLYVVRLQQGRIWHPISCPLDDLILFNEWFLIPYLGWFVFLIGMLLYTFLCDTASFRKMMYFIMITYGTAMLVYLVYPTSQELRPVEFERDNVLTQFISWFYTFDTNTNVCPSIHVLGAMSVVCTAWHAPRFATIGWRAVFVALGFLISISTVFMKQHSIIDIGWAFLLSAFAGWIVYRE